MKAHDSYQQMFVDVWAARGRPDCTHDKYDVKTLPAAARSFDVWIGDVFGRIGGCNAEGGVAGRGKDH